MGWGRGFVRLGYYSNIGLGSLALLVVALVYESWTLAVLAALVVGLAAWRLYVLRTDPDE
jgi:hypothetical protein